MFEKIRNLIADKLDIDADKITMESKFSDLKVDSLDMVEIVMDLEEEFDVTIEANEDMTTVGDLVEYIQNASK